MKLFVPLHDDALADPAIAALPLVPFRLDFPCQRDLDRDGIPRLSRRDGAVMRVSDECPVDPPA